MQTRVQVGYTCAQPVVFPLIPTCKLSKGNGGVEGGEKGWKGDTANGKSPQWKPPGTQPHLPLCQGHLPARCATKMMAMSGKQHLGMHPALSEPKYSSLHASPEGMRRVCLPAPQVRFKPIRHEGTHLKLVTALYIFLIKKGLILLSSHPFPISNIPPHPHLSPFPPLRAFPQPPLSLSLSPTLIHMSIQAKRCFHINFYDLCFEEGSLCAWKCFLILSWQYSQLTSTCAFLLAAPGQYIRWLWWESAGPRGSSGGCWHCLSRQKSPFQAGRDLPYHE